MREDIRFNNRWASEFGLEEIRMKIGSVDPYKGAGNQVQTFTVPGRDGEIYPAYNDRLAANELKEYSSALYLRRASNQETEEAFAAIRAWLLSPKGYKNLQDSYEPDFYRRAFFCGDFIPSRKGAGNNFVVPLCFNCDPRRYIYDAETILLRSGADGALVREVSAPSDWAELITEQPNPLIKVEAKYNNAAFTLSIEDNTGTELGSVSFAANIGTLYFDAETMSASGDEEGTSNLNAWITDVFGDLSLPKSCRIRRTNVDAEITITPRWWVR